jgi:hypothetical protein
MLKHWPTFQVCAHQNDDDLFSDVSAVLDTLVVLACPYTKLVDEAMIESDSIISLDQLNAECLKMQLTIRGQIVLSSYELLAQQRCKLSSVKAKGVNIIVVFDEVRLNLTSFVAV